jgi:hypothetical protein
MAKELDHVDISDVPEVLRLAEEVHKSNKPRVLTRNHEQLAVIMPLQQPRRRGRRTGVITRDDPLFRMIGTGRSGIPGGISGRKYEYFAKAFRPDDDAP